MKVYIAGSSQQRQPVEELAKYAEMAGHDITRRWWEEFKSRWVGSKSYDQIATEDLQGVASADVLIVLLDSVQKSEGAHLELGYALALGKPVLALLSDWDAQIKENIWVHLPQVRAIPRSELETDTRGLTKELDRARLTAGVIIDV